MDDVYRINVAKTEFRDAYNTGDVDRLLSVFHEDFVDMSDGFPSNFGSASSSSLRKRATELFAKYSVRLVVIIVDVVPIGDTAYEFGWHEFTLMPKSGGETVHARHRYLDLWKKDTSGTWKISFFLNNADVHDTFNGNTARWFISEDQVESSR